MITLAKIAIVLIVLFFVSFLTLFWYFIISTGIRSIIKSVKNKKGK